MTARPGPIEVATEVLRRSHERTCPMCQGRQRDEQLQLAFDDVAPPMAWRPDTEERDVAVVQRRAG